MARKCDFSKHFTVKQTLDHLDLKCNYFIINPIRQQENIISPAMAISDRERDKNTLKKCVNDNRSTMCEAVTMKKQFVTYEGFDALQNNMAGNIPRQVLA